MADFSGFLLPERQTRSVLPGGRWHHRHHGPRQHPGVHRRPEVPGSAARVEGPEAEDDQRDTQRHKGEMMMMMMMIFFFFLVAVDSIALYFTYKGEHTAF